MIIISQWKTKVKKYNDKKSKDNQIKDHSNKQRSRLYKDTGIKVGKKSKIFELTAPECLSIIDNTEGAYDYFEKFVNEIRQKNMNEFFYFDLKDVKHLTVDAVMYILTILRNIKNGYLFKFTFAGCHPQDGTSRKLLIESGFNKYVKTIEIDLNRNSDKIQIVQGSQVDSETAKNICDFVSNRCGLKILYTGTLYEVLIELMTNTRQHAYSAKDSVFLNQWYVFVEKNDDNIKIVFLDTGEGLTQTIKKKALEKFGEIFLQQHNDSFYIESALNGDWRSETQEKNRGKGLPSAEEYAHQIEINNFQIFSGSGSCIVWKNMNEKYVKYKYNNKLFGTLFSWEIDIKSIGKEFLYDKD